MTTRLARSGATAPERPRAAVTGSGGVLGRALVAELSTAGYDVVALRRADADLMRLDEAVAVFERVKPQIVFHLAARVAGLGGNLAAPGEMFYENVVINTNVVEAARRVGARKIVAAGTCAIYSDMVALPMKEDDLWLGAPHRSEAPYGHAKRALLAQLEAYRSQYGISFVYAILTNIFGPHDRFDEAYGHVTPSLISKFHRAKRDREPVTVWGTGTAERDLLYAKDAARALRLVAEGAEGPINIASGQQHAIRKLVEAVATAAEFDGDIVWDRSKPDGQRRRRYDVTRLNGLEFTPAYTLQEAISETYTWYDRHMSATRS